MGNELEELVLKFEADLADFKTQLVDAIKSLNNVEDAVDKTSKSVFEGVASWDLLKDGVRRATDFMKDAVSESTKADATMSLVKRTVEAAGSAWKDASGVVDKFSKQMAKMGRDDESAALSISKLYRATGDWTKAQKVATLASDLMASGIGDVESNTQALTELMGGNASKAAKMLGIKIGETATVTDVLDAAQQRVTQTTEQWAQTSEGMISKVNVAWGNIKETIGGAFMNAMDGVLRQGGDYLDQAGEQLSSTNTLSRAFYSISNVLLGVWDIVAGVGNLLGALGNAMIGLSQITWGFAKDVWNAFTNIGKIGTDVFGAISQALTGDFGGALEKIKGVFTSTFSNTGSAAAGAGAVMTEAFAMVGENALSSAKHFTEAFTQSGFKNVEKESGDAADKVNRDWEPLAQNIGSSAKEAAQDFEKPFKDMVDTLKKTFDTTQNSIDDVLNAASNKLDKKKSKWKDYKESALKELKDLERGHKKTMEDIESQIDELKTNFQDAQKSNTADFKSNLGEQVVAAEDKMKEISAAIAEEQAKGTGGSSTDYSKYGTIIGNASALGGSTSSSGGADQDKLADLKAQLAEQQSILNSGKKYIEQYNIDIDAVRERAHLNAVDRMALEFSESQTIAQAEYDSEMALLEQQKNDEVSLYNTKYDKIEERLENHRTKYKSKVQKIKEHTKDALHDIVHAYKEAFNKIDDVVLNSKFADVIKSMQALSVGSLDKSELGKVLGFKKTGGDIMQTGMYMLHAGEQVVPADQVARGGAGGAISVEVNFNNPTVRNDSDLKHIVSVVKQSLSRDLEMARYGSY